MNISNNSSIYNNNTLFPTKKASNTSYHHFSQNVNNNLSLNSTNSSAAKVTLYKDAIISSHNASGTSAHVYYGEASGTYIVKGIDTDGKEYETTVDITNVDPNNASRIEMIAFAAHLKDPDAASFLLTSHRERTAFASLPDKDKTNFEWKSLFVKENQYDDLKSLAQSFYKAGAIDGYATVNNLIQTIMLQVGK